MCTKTHVMGLIAVLFVVVLVPSTHADRHTVELTAKELTAFTPSNTAYGDYYVVTIDVPDVLQGKELLGAFMEFVVDVDSRTINEVSNETPMLELYALSEDFGNELEPGKLEKNTPTRRNVVVGDNRRVKIDITPIVKGFLANPNSNHGLVLGSLSNARDGLFDVKSANGRLATITYYYTSSEPE